MTKKSKKTSPAAKADQSSTKVTRITASDTGRKAAKTETPVKSAKIKDTAPTKATPAKKESKGILHSIGGYFKGSWHELHQVRWPNRRTTWSLTAAVLAFSLFFVVLIMLLDYGFQVLFERILG